MIEKSNLGNTITDAFKWSLDKIYKVENDQVTFNKHRIFDLEN